MTTYQITTKHGRVYDDHALRLMAQYGRYTDADLAALVQRGQFAEYERAEYWREQYRDLRDVPEATQTYKGIQPVTTADTSVKLNATQAARSSALPVTQAQVQQRAELVKRSFAGEQTQQPVQRSQYTQQTQQAGLTVPIIANLQGKPQPYSGTRAYQNAQRGQVQKSQTKAQTQQAQQPAVSVRVHPAGPHFSGAWVPEQQFVSVKDQIRASVVLPPAGQQPTGPRTYMVELPAGRPPALREQKSAAVLPISPETGKPSRLTAAIRASVGIK